MTRSCSLRVRLARGLGVAALAIAALTACTGTFEESAPLVLLVATEPTQPGDDAAIVAYLVEPPGAATLRTVTPLGPSDLAPGVSLPLVGWDWVDRDALAVGPGRGRTRLVALASARSDEPGERRALLHRFDLADFDADAPVLAPVDPSPLSLVVGGAWDEDAFPADAGASLPLDGVCLTGVSVSSDGRFAALLDHRAACGDGDAVTSLLVVDLTDRALVWSSTIEGDVVPVRPYVDQARDHLDVWRRASGRAEWRELELATLELSAPLVAPDVGVPTAAAPAGAERWVLVDGRLYAWRGDAAIGSGVASATSDASTFVTTGPGLPVVILGPDLWVHPTPSAEALRVQGTAGTYTAGTTDGPDRLTYLVRPGVIDTLDLLVLTPDEPLTRVISPAFRDPPGDPRLVAPTLVTWFRPRLPPTP
jgi:hypothetical protein